MIGVFDSGAGGLFALAELRRLSPNADIVYLADRKNAPYGTKSREVLTELVKKDIEKLCEAGCTRVLMACCTASTVYDLLPYEYRAVAVPIIEPVARAAVMTSRNKKIGVLSTEATRKSGVFVEKILKYAPTAVTVCASAPELVTLAEKGECDARLSKNGFLKVKKSVSAFLGSGIDTLILGCTHFAYFENTIKNILRITTVNSAHIGASLMQDLEYGRGSTRFLD